MQPLDLRNAPPRSCYAELDGLLLMPRTIDKLRGRLPGGDPGEALFGAGASCETEDDIAAWLGAHADASQYPAINETLRRIKPKHAEDPAWFRQAYAETLALHPELEIIMDIVDADDRRLFERYTETGTRS